MANVPEIIAEAGSNHNGDPRLACALIDCAAEAGSSSVKFQFIFADGLYLPEFYGSMGYVPNTAYAQRKTEEMSEMDWFRIWAHARDKQISVSASVFCERGLLMLKHLGSTYVKIASTDLTNHELILSACASFERVIVSTGMSTFAEIDNMLNSVLPRYPNTDLQLMHCVSAYPCPLEDSNTQRIRLLKHAFGRAVGYSDHTSDTFSASMALVQGADFFEKHFTIDPTLPGFDHAHALNCQGLKEYVHTLTSASSSLETPPNGLSKLEQVTRIRARRGVYAARDLPAGHVLCKDDLLFVRPSTDFALNDPLVCVGQQLVADVPRFAAIGPAQGFSSVASNWQSALDYWGREMSEKGMLPPPSVDDQKS